MNRLFSFILLFSLTVFNSQGQFLNKVITPPGQLQLCYIDDNLFSIVVFEKTGFDSTQQYYQRWSVYEKEQNSWKKICHVDLNYSDVIIRHFKSASGYYFYGRFRRTLDTGFYSALLVYENGVLKKIPLHHLFPGTQGSEYSEGYSYVHHNTGGALIGDTLYLAVNIHYQNVHTFNAGIRYYPGGSDTLVVKRGDIIDVMKGPDGNPYTMKSIDPKSWQLLQGRVTGYSKPFDMSYVFDSGTDTAHLEYDFTSLSKNPLSGDYMVAGNADGICPVYVNKKWKSLKINSSPAFPNGHRFRRYAYLDGIPYASVEFGGIYYLYSYQEHSWELYGSLTEHKRLATYKNELYVISEMSPYEIFKVQGKERILNGIVYHDLNQNCKNDPGEKGLKYCRLLFQPGNRSCDVQDNGYYICSLDTGVYDVTVTDLKYKDEDCESLKGIDIRTTTELKMDIPFRRIPGKRDVGVGLQGSRAERARRGDTLLYFVNIKNHGISVSNSEFILEYDKRWTYFSSSWPCSRIDSTHISFSADVPENEIVRLAFQLYADPSTYKNDDVTILNVKLKDPLDSDTTDNEDTLRVKIVAAYDPNEKRAYPSGQVPLTVKEIRYHIDFQNLGTDSAVNIVVQDTLDGRFNLESLQLTGASHAYRFSMKGDVIKWTFPKIMLPPASVNYKESMGYASFTCRLKESLPSGDSVRNRAFIYFDYEEAVITNHAVSIYNPFMLSVSKPIKQYLAGTLIAYPNPVDHELFVTFEEEGQHRLFLYDAMGRLTGTWVHNGKGEAMIDTHMLSEGIYLLKDERGNFSRIVITR